jgi:hypothetical protein
MHIYTHKHHIIPKHIGGTDDPSNLIELTIEDHAIAHRHLWKMYGRWQDRLAWLALSGRIDKEEISRKIVSEANTGRKHSLETRRKISEGNKGKHKNNKGPQSAEHRKKIANAHKGRKRGTQSAEHRKKISESLKRYYN